jgi:hypothetical protein
VIDEDQLNHLSTELILLQNKISRYSLALPR